MSLTCAERKGSSLCCCRTQSPGPTDGRSRLQLVSAGCGGELLTHLGRRPCLAQTGSSSRAPASASPSSLLSPLSRPPPPPSSSLSPAPAPSPSLLPLPSSLLAYIFPFPSLSAESSWGQGAQLKQDKTWGVWKALKTFAFLMMRFQRGKAQP